MSGRYLDLNLTIRNQGLADSPAAEIEVYADDKSVKKIGLESLKIGHGRLITVTNIFVFQKDVDELRFLIKTNFEELEKDNNEAVLNYSN